MEHFNIIAKNLPQDWETVEDFMTWYMENGMPFIPPENAKIYTSDDATSVALFRKGRYQVELYLVHSAPLVQTHEHPNVEVIKMRIDSNGKAFPSSVLKNGQSHGAGVRVDNMETGFPLLAFQKWLDKNPTTVAASWRGKTVGPKHEKLIRENNADPFVVEGYADTTKTMEYLKEVI